jgi:hypothetical protein
VARLEIGDVTVTARASTSAGKQRWGVGFTAGFDPPPASLHTAPIGRTIVSHVNNYNDIGWLYNRTQCHTFAGTVSVGHWTHSGIGRIRQE